MTAIFAGRVTGELHQHTPVRARCNQPEAALRHLGASLGFGAAKPRLDGSCQIPSLVFFGDNLRTRDPEDHSKAATRPVTREIAVPGPSRSAVFNVPLLLQSCMQPIFRDNSKRHSLNSQTPDRDCNLRIRENRWAAVGDTCFVLLRSVFGTLHPNYSNQRLQQIPECLVPARPSSKFRGGTARDLTPIPAIGARLSRPVRARG